MDINKHVYFNLILKHRQDKKFPDQLIHVDSSNPKEGILVFAHFMGEDKNFSNTFIVTNAHFTVVETDFTKENHKPVYHEIVDNSFEYKPSIKRQSIGGERTMKQISFKFKKTHSKNPLELEFKPNELFEVKKDDFLNLEVNLVNKNGRVMTRNINSHICQSCFYFK